VNASKNSLDHTIHAQFLMKFEQKVSNWSPKYVKVL